MRRLKAMMMKKKFKVAGRGSWLSRAQIETFRKIAETYFPEIGMEEVILDTNGDRDQSTPLHLVEGKDFFTRDIQDALKNGKADFAVHSMKDVSGADFFANSHYAVIDREDPRDVAIFKDTVNGKLERGGEIIIGTSSPRRSHMAVRFLQKALPQPGGVQPVIRVVPIRGNVDVRLHKLNEGPYDGIILAAAGLNRLLEFEPSRDVITQLLCGKKKMLLPLFECPPAAGQGAIVVETSDCNPDAIQLLRRAGNAGLTSAIGKERVYAERYGYGCSREFGVFHLDTPNISFTYVSGRDEERNDFREWSFDPVPDVVEGNLFVAADHMKSFFSYHYLSAAVDETKDTFFISSHKAIHSDALVQSLHDKRIWTAGTKTWLELAGKGLWVEGCADGLGIQSIHRTLESPLFGIILEDMQLITNEESAGRWIAEGWNAVGTYRLVPERNDRLRTLVGAADALFWTSFQQYNLFRQHIKPGAVHFCLAGKTASLLAAEGLRPFIFPGIKAFRQWQNRHTPAYAGE